jgi:hypothetical protein
MGGLFVTAILSPLCYVGVTEKVARFLSGSEKIIKSNQNIEK